MKNHIFGLLAIALAFPLTTWAADGGKPDAPEITFKLPDINQLSNDEAGKQIRLGRRLLEHTDTMLPNNVGNDLRCTSCHLEVGTVPYGLPWVDTTANYPRYISRSDSMVDIQGRINGCFTRSMNGKALDKNSKEMAAIVSYMEWLAAGVPKGKRIPGSSLVKIDRELEPNVDNGKLLYVQHCSACHRPDAAGLYPNQKYLYPAVAGNRSFNDGAGMARTYTAAAFIQHNMPLYNGNTLTAQEAVDVAEYITKLPRPVFPNKDKDWPNGGRPKDARN